MHLMLIGYRGTGKTTVAERLADALELPWVDADVEIERRAGCSIAEIFSQGGEAAFRELESQVVAELAAGPDAVVALGGGAILAEPNREALRPHRVVWLTATSETIQERISGDPTTSQRRPNLTTGGLTEIETLLARREPIYRELADAEIATDGKTIDQVVNAVLSWLQDLGVSPDHPQGGRT